jgi:site-specific recombinase XerD
MHKTDGVYHFLQGGRGDAVLLSVLYDTGARVQELIGLSAGDVRLDPPAQLRFLGKGRGCVIPHAYIRE